MTRLLLLLGLCLVLASCGQDETDTGAGEEEIQAAEQATGQDTALDEDQAEEQAVAQEVDQLSGWLTGGEQGQADAADAAPSEEPGPATAETDEEEAESTLLSLAQATEEQAAASNADELGLAEGEEVKPENFVDFVKQSILFYDEERTVGQVIDEYSYFTGINWKEYEYQGRMMVEATASYDIPSALTALRDEDPEADGKFVGQSLGELAEVTTIMYFSVDKDMTTLEPPSSSGLAHCKNGKTTTFMPGGVQLVYDDMPPRIKDVYRQCFN